MEYRYRTDSGSGNVLLLWQQEEWSIDIGQIVVVVNT